MKLIAHRGNLKGPNKETENTIEQIMFCLESNFDVEIDLWYDNESLWLGHDEPQNKISLSLLLDNSNKLWCHCKNIECLVYLLKHEVINCFWHQEDDYVITSKKNIWVYPGKSVPGDGIVVMPELFDYKYDKNKIMGICTDYVIDYRKFLI